MYSSTIVGCLQSLMKSMTQTTTEIIMKKNPKITAILQEGPKTTKVNNIDKYPKVKRDIIRCMTAETVRLQRAMKRAATLNMGSTWHGNKRM